MNFYEARNIILENISPVSSENVSLSEAAARISYYDITATYNVPAFDRSPYDGYAFKAGDTPAKLKIVEEIRAGDVPNIAINSGEAAKILTGAKIPAGADSVIKFEDTEFNNDTVIISKKFHGGENIIKAGEDVKTGDILVKKGDFIDSGKAGLIASQGIAEIKIYKRPTIGIISTGNELQDLSAEISDGKIYNTSRYAFEAALKISGFTPRFIAIIDDDEQKISRAINESISLCDALILTGGVSVGDYDKTSEALKISGAKIIVRNIALKPGGKCIYAVKNNKLICCLSGNPASALTNYYAVALPALKKLSGLNNFIPAEITITLDNAFNKKSPQMRIIRGKMLIKDGKIFMHVPSEQGNGVLSTIADSNLMAVIPANSEKLQEGTQLKGFII